MHEAAGFERFRALIVAIAPVALLGGFLYHPYIGLGPPNEAAITSAVMRGTTRWGLAHLLLGIASAAVILALLAVRAHLREMGENRWSPRAVPAIVISGTLYAMLPGMELAATLGAVGSGASVAAAQDGVTRWFVPVLAVSALTGLVAACDLGRGIVESRILSGSATRIVVGALVTMAVARAVPLSVVQFYVQGAAAIVALWPIAALMRAGAGAPPIATRHQVSAR